MQKLTFQEIKNIFTELADRRSSEFELEYLLNNEISNQNRMLYQTSKTFHHMVKSLGDFIEVAGDDAGREGYDDVQIWRVYHFTDHDVLIKVVGWWSSTSGSKFEKMQEVFPTTKTITVYE